MMKSLQHSDSIMAVLKICLDLTPDLTAFGKIIGGGLPIGAYGGKKEIMEQVAPLGPAYQAGTMAGNPASMLAGIACLEVLQATGYLRRNGSPWRQYLKKELLESAKEHGITLTTNRLGGALTLFFTDVKVENYEQAEATDGEIFAKFFKLMLKNGINLAPSKYEAWFLTTAHTETEIEETLIAVDKSFKELAAT